MTTRTYRSWDTISSGYVPRRTYGSYTTTSEPYFNSYSSYRPYYKSYRKLEDSAAYPYSGNTSSYKFDFVNGRYTNDCRYTHLRDAQEPTYYQELTDLYLTTNKLQQDYRNILDRYNTDRTRGYGCGLPEAYGRPRYMDSERAPPSERYGLYDRSTRRYGNRQYDTDITEYDYPHYERSKREEYHGSVGGVLYNKDLHKGSYDLHDSGPRTREELDLWEHAPGDRRAGRAGYEREGYDRGGPDPRGYTDSSYRYDRSGYDSRDTRYQRDGREPYGHHDREGREPYGHDRYGDDSRYRDRDVDRSRDIGDNNRHSDLNDRGRGGGGGGGGGGLKKSASRHDVDGYNRDRGDRGDRMSGIRDDEYDDDDIEGDFVGEKRKYDSGINSPDDDLFPGMEDEDLFEEEALPELEPEPEICVYNEITQEDFQQMQEEEAAKEKPLCDYPLIATVTSQLVKIDKIVGEFKRPVGDNDTPVNLSPLPGMTTCYITSPLPSSRTPDPLDFDLATSNKAAGDSGGQEVKLEFEDPTKTPLGVSANVVQVSEETIVTETTEEIIEEILPESTVPAEVHLTLDPVMPAEYEDIVAKPVEAAAPAPRVAPVQAETATEITMTPATTQHEKRQEKPTEKREEAAVSVKIEREADEIISKGGESGRKSAEEQPKMNGEIKGETKPATKEEVSKEDNGKNKEQKPKSPAAKPKSPAEKPKSPEKKGRLSKFGQQTSPTPKPSASSPKKKRLW